MPLFGGINGKDKDQIANINGVPYPFNISEVSGLDSYDGLLDIYSGATLGLSTRRLSNDPYWDTNPCMTVCLKSNINTELDVYFTPEGWIDTASIFTWADANGAISSDAFGSFWDNDKVLVKKWYNQAKIYDTAQGTNTLEYFEIPGVWVDGPSLSDISAQPSPGNEHELFARINNKPSVDFRNLVDFFGDSSEKSYMNAHDTYYAAEPGWVPARARSLALTKNFFVNAVLESPYSVAFTPGGVNDTAFRALLMQFDNTVGGNYNGEQARVAQFRWYENKGRSVLSSRVSTTNPNSIDDTSATYTHSTPYYYSSLLNGDTNQLISIQNGNVSGEASTTLNSNHQDSWPYGVNNVMSSYDETFAHTRIGASSNIGAGLSDSELENFGTQVINGGFSGFVSEIIMWGDDPSSVGINTYADYTSSIWSDVSTVYGI